VNDELEMIWKDLEGFGRKKMCFNFKVLSWHLPGGTDKNHKKKKKQESQSPNRDLKLNPPNMKQECISVLNYATQSWQTTWKQEETFRCLFLHSCELHILSLR
jgi:hypothetical protein